MYFSPPDPSTARTPTTSIYMWTTSSCLLAAESSQLLQWRVLRVVLICFPRIQALASQFEDVVGDNCLSIIVEAIQKFVEAGHNSFLH